MARARARHNTQSAVARVDILKLKGNHRHAILESAIPRMIRVHSAALDPYLVQTAAGGAGVMDLRIDVVEAEARAAELCDDRVDGLCHKQVTHRLPPMDHVVLVGDVLRHSAPAAAILCGAPPGEADVVVRRLCLLRDAPIHDVAQLAERWLRHGIGYAEEPLQIEEVGLAIVHTRPQVTPAEQAGPAARAGHYSIL